jgi:hypothetical protein
MGDGSACGYISMSNTFSTVAVYVFMPIVILIDLTFCSFQDQEGNGKDLQNEAGMFL